ncbi:hypothetical protein HYH02_003827 [Chlamydomonas schloesseri]|uniref:Uncharacterized protein n=1 Tax=Chlamydomonas schloesseri TaxID=2026947 RepID=A0A836B9B4_9CHLO|nr:hypothetical protein HYH02_003827 [Chlamydomonas schloesseri]|eukprot:KAG2451220.1 hypothetical protein HYH02_003827 [Chlamydomonas schloesseri]
MASGPIEQDIWLGLDKLEHWLACGFCTLVVYWLCKRHHRLFRGRFTFGLLVGLLVGLLKELGDYLQLWPGALSGKDLVADVAGSLCAAAGLYLAEAKWGPPAPPHIDRHATGCWGTVRSVLGLPNEPRVVDLEHGLVYGQRILRQGINNSLKDLRSLIPSSAALTRWGSNIYGYKPLAVGAGGGGGGGRGSSVLGGGGGGGGGAAGISSGSAVSSGGAMELHQTASKRADPSSA